MKKSLLTVALALACAAITFSLAVRAQAQTVTYLTKFGGTNGSQPWGSVVQATDGNFYGTTAFGGNGHGNVFRMTPGGKVTSIYSFCPQTTCTDGEIPETAPILGSDGASGVEFFIGLLWQVRSRSSTISVPKPIAPTALSPEESSRPAMEISTARRTMEGPLASARCSRSALMELSPIFTHL